MALTNILITGGCGFIGSNLVHRLEAKGYSIRVLDNMTRGDPRRLHGTHVDVREGDIRDFETVRGAVSGMDSVIHLAAYGSVVESVSDPGVNFYQNVAGTFSVLEAVRNSNVRKFVFASTGGALIGEATLPVDEDSLPRPISPYGASKLCGEGYCHAFGKSYGVDTVSLRFGNVYGPYSAHKKGAITSFINAVMRNEPIVVYGDGSASRDFVYVEDLCKGIELALASDVTRGSVFHLAAGEETRIADLARTVATIGGRPGHPIEYKQARPAEVTRNFATYERARRILGFEPEWSLDQGLQATWRWFWQQRDAALAVEQSDS